jgi:hypothetical protein
VFIINLDIEDKKYFLKYNDLVLNVKIIVRLLPDNLLQFILDTPDPFVKLEESSGPFKDKAFDPFKITVAFITFKEDSLEAFTMFEGDNQKASTSFKDNIQDLSIPFEIIRVGSIPSAFTFLVMVSHIANLFMVKLLVNSSLKE